MKLPSPSDPAGVPFWRNYVVAQCVQASLGELPRHIVAFGVLIDDVDINLQFQLSEILDDDLESIDEIVDELETLVGPDVRVAVTRRRADRPIVSPFDQIAWIFIARH